MTIVQHPWHHHKGSLDCAKPKHNLGDNMLQVWATLLPSLLSCQWFWMPRWLLLYANAGPCLAVGEENIVPWLHSRIVTVDQMRGLWRAGKESSSSSWTSYCYLLISLKIAENVYSCFFKKINLFIYLFLAALALCCWAQAFASCGKRGLLFVAVRGLLIAVVFLVAEHRP